MATVRVEGLRQVVRSLERMGVEVQDLKRVFKTIGGLVATDAKRQAPVLTGRLAASIRPSNTKNKATVRAGSAAVPYAGVIHYGGYNNIQPNRFLTDALDQNRARVRQELDRELERLIHRLDLR